MAEQSSSARWGKSQGSVHHLPARSALPPVSYGPCAKIGFSILKLNFVTRLYEIKILASERLMGTQPPRPFVCVLATAASGLRQQR